MSLNHLKHQNAAKFAEQTITRCPLGSILVSPAYKQIVIPLFQRPYCWPENQLRGWIENVKQGAEIIEGNEDIFNQLASIDKTNSEDFHSVGIGRFKTSADSLICVDGQQRLTTTSLLISALCETLKSVLLNEKESHCQGLIDVAEHCLYNDVKQVHVLLKNAENSDPSDLQPFVRLLPSELDRIPYFCALLNRKLQYVTTENNFIIQTKKYFQTYLENLVSPMPSSKKVSVLSNILRSSLVWMRMMKVEVESDIHLGQWFLWLQEKSLFGLAALLCNNTPGIKFNAGDLVKNLLISAFIEKPMEFQETLFSSNWIQPIQKEVKDHLDDFLDNFLFKENFKDVLMKDENSTRYMSAYEKQILDLLNAHNDDEDTDDDEKEISDINVDKFSGIRLYGRFHSYYDAHLHGTDPTPQDLESIHFSILNDLKKFAIVYTNK